jgi:hypothetical protein
VLPLASKARCCPPAPNPTPHTPTAPVSQHTPCRGFKALKQIVKLHFKLGQKDKMMEAYRWVCLPRPAPPLNSLERHLLVKTPQRCS